MLHENWGSSVVTTSKSSKNSGLNSKGDAVREIAKEKKEVELMGRNIASLIDQIQSEIFDCQLKLENLRGYRNRLLQVLNTLIFTREDMQGLVTDTLTYHFPGCSWYMERDDNMKSGLQYVCVVELPADRTRHTDKEWDKKRWTVHNIVNQEFVDKYNFHPSFFVFLKGMDKHEQKND